MTSSSSVINESHMSLYITASLSWVLGSKLSRVSSALLRLVVRDPTTGELDREMRQGLVLCTELVFPSSLSSTQNFIFSTAVDSCGSAGVSDFEEG